MLSFYFLKHYTFAIAIQLSPCNYICRYSYVFKFNSMNYFVVVAAAADGSKRFLHLHEVYNSSVPINDV